MIGDMRYEVMRRIAAEPDVVWEALADVARWPEWTTSMSEVRPSESGPLRVGMRVTVVQPWLAPQVWEVTELVPDVGFRWEAHAPGMTTAAGHWLRERPDGVEVTLSVEQTGPTAVVLATALRPLARRYVRLEAEGLRRVSEARSR